MLRRALYAILVAVIAILVCVLLGALLITIQQVTIQAIGQFLESNAGLIGILAGIAYFVFGYRA